MSTRPSNDRPLRIALLTHSVNPRGGVVHTLELAEALGTVGHQVTVMAPALPGQQFFRQLACQVDLVPVESRSVQEAPEAGEAAVVAMVASRIEAYVIHLRKRLGTPDAPRFDVFHAQDSISGNALAELQHEGWIEGFVRTVHHLDRFTDPRLEAWQRRAYVDARLRLCVSDLWCRHLEEKEGLPAYRVNNGVDLKRYHPKPSATDAAVAARLGLRPGAPLLLAVGGVEARKNTLRVLEAFIQLRGQYPQAQLAIVGGASLLDHEDYGREFHALLTASGLGQGSKPGVVLTGPVADADMPALYRLANAVVMASLREGFGLVVLESLASGTPVVVSRIQPFTEYLDDADRAGPGVHWTDPSDAPSMAKAMECAVGMPAFPVPPVCQDYAWSASAKRHVELYRLLGTSTSFPRPDLGSLQRGPNDSIDFSLAPVGA